MKRLVVFAFLLGAAIVSACENGPPCQDCAEVSMDERQVAADRLPGVAWEDFEAGKSLMPSPLDVAVTVRTDPAVSVTIFGQPFDTNGEQWWIHGRSGETEATRQVKDPDRLFWTTEPVDPAEYLRYEAEIGRSLEAGEPVPFDDYPEPPEVYFRVNGYSVAVKLWTRHEGQLERIHIDTPTGRSGEHVTVIGYYSRSASTTALEFPRTRCIWCGEIEVCTANPQCP